jgi:hypothetical protein
MPNLNTLLADVKDLKQDLELLQAVGDLVKEWPRLAAEVTDLSSAEKLLDRLAADVNDPQLVTAFDKIGAGPLRAQLAKVIGRVKTLDGKIPADVKVLLRRTSEFQELDQEHPGQVSWTVEMAETVPLAQGFDLKIGSKAQLEFEAGDAGFNTGGSRRPVLRVKAGGNLEAKAGGTVPFQGGALKASAAASTGLSLEGFFDLGNGGGIYAIDVVRSLRELPNPFDFESVGTAFDTTDLAGLAYHFEGATSGQLQISLADGFSLGHGVTAMLAATVSVGMSQSASHSLVLRRGAKNDDGEYTIHAKLTRRRIHSRDFKASLGLTVDVSALTGRVHEVLKGAVGKWDEVLGEVQPYLSPGTALKGALPKLLEEAAGKLIGDAALHKAIVQDLSGALGLDTSDDVALAGWVEAELIGALDRSGVLSDAQGAAKAAVSELKRSLPAFAQPAVAAKLDAEIDKLAKAAADEFAAAVKRAVDGAGAAKVGAALKAAGAESQKVYKKLDDALAGARELVAKYDALFKKILASSEAATKAKITATLLIEESRSNSDEYQFGGVILDRSESAEAVFEALTHGNTKSLLPILEGQSVGGFSLDRNSSLRRFSKSASKRGFEVVLLNFGGITGATLLTAEAESLVDGEGNVQIDSRARLEKNFKGLREGRRVAFADVAKLVLAKPSDGEETLKRALELGVSVTHEDKSLKRSETQKFIGSLVDSGLMPEAARTKAAEQFNDWTEPGSDHLRADIAAKMWLSGDSARRLMRLDKRQGDGRLSRSARLEIIELGHKLWVDAALLDAEAFQRGARIARRRYMKSHPDSLSTFEIVHDLYDLELDNTMEVFTGDGAAENQRLVDRFRAAAVPLYHLMRLIQLMGDVYTAPPTWTLETFREKQAEIGKATTDWLRISTKHIFWVDSEVHPRTVALFRAIALLAEAPPAGAMGLVMTHRPKGADPETAVLV